MKKIFLFFLCLTGLLVITSCKGDEVDYTTQVLGLTTELSNTWLNDCFLAEGVNMNNPTAKEGSVNIGDTCENNGTFVAGTEVYLPADIKGSLRYSVANVTSNIKDDKLKRMAVSSYSFTSQYNSSTADLTTNHLNDMYDESEVTVFDHYVKNVDASISLTYNGYSYNVDTNIEYNETDNIYLSVLYLPLFVRTYIDNPNTKSVSLYVVSYVIVPVYYHLFTSTADNLSVDESLANYNTANINVIGGLLADLPKEE